TFFQSPQAVARSTTTGKFVVTWSSNGQDGSGWGVYGQRYDANGNPLGGEFRVNTTTAGDQQYTAVALDPTGDFVITWTSNGQDGKGWGVYAQRYAANGNPLGGEFQVNATTDGDQQYSAVALDATGDFVITWLNTAPDLKTSIAAQRFDASGTPQGGEFKT